MRQMLLLLLSTALSGCMAFPSSIREADFQLRQVVDSIECELAAAAMSQLGQERQLEKWNVLTDLNITLERNIGADGTVSVGVPVGAGGLGVSPKIGGSDTDLRINTLKFATSIKTAVARFKPTCFGDNPSQTNMGLANWIEGTLGVVDPDDLVTVSFTKQFRIVVSGGVRFGYVLVPVTNTIDASAGFSAYRDYINRFTIALTPPPERPKPARVFVTNWPKSLTPTPSARSSEPEPADGAAERRKSDLRNTTPPEGAPERRTEPSRTIRRGGPTPRERAIQDPILRNEIQSKSPIFLQQ
jgi:hypothetical protein